MSWKMYNKGEIQFYWIFTIVAGAIILAFLVSFGLKFKEVQEEKTTIRILNNLEGSFSTLQGAQFKTSTSLTLPVNLRVQCNELGNNLVIDGKALKTDSLIFSSGSLNGNVLIGFSPHKLPFKISNFFYMIRSLDTYSFVYDSRNKNLVESIGEDFKDYFPNNIEITDNPANALKVYFYKKDNELYVIPETEESGKIFFRDGSNVDYYNKAMLYGAIIARENSVCLFNEAEKKKKEIIEVYRNKIEKLPGNCNYNNVMLSLQRLENAKGREIAEISNALERQNQALLDNNCPLVF